MEIINAESSSGPRSLFPPPSLSNDERRDSPLSISCNWQVSNNKQLIDAVTTASIKYAPERVSCETVVSLDTCVALQPVDSNAEPCVLTIEVLNCQKIARIAIVSEGNVLEIFKQFGEYEGTITAEFIDEFEKSVVYLGETTIHPPTTEVGIKFIRTRNKGPSMWVYGITLFLTESTKEAKPSAFDYDIIQTFFSNAGRDKMSQVSEMARMFGLYGERETARNCSEKPLETREACTNEIERGSSEKELAHRGDNCEQSNATECKNGVARRDSGTERLSCARNSKRSDADLVSRLFCRRRPKIPNPRFDDIKEDLLKAFGGEDEMCLCDNNRFLSEKYLQRKSGAPTSDSDPFKCRNKNGDDARDYRSREVENSQCRKRPINRVSAEELTNREDYKKFRSYIANKLCDMEGRLMKRIDEMEAGTNRKLNAILERLETLN